jgi:hypothetical protein
MLLTLSLLCVLQQPLTARQGSTGTQGIRIHLLAENVIISIESLKEKDKLFEPMCSVKFLIKHT